jgi:antitoxin component YwqK of YwqJK toxin-antitoxin module
MNTDRRNHYRILTGAVALVALGMAVWLAFPRRAKPAPVMTVAHHDLVLRDGRWYRQTESNAFTGIMLDVYPNGATLAHSAISNGVANGLSETWYTNGQLQMRENFRDGVSDGFRQKWYENGAKMSEANIVDGKITGLFQSWYENGRPKERIEMKAGNPDGVAWAFYPSGFTSAETSLQEGKVLNRKTWKDGEYKTTP